MTRLRLFLLLLLILILAIVYWRSSFSNSYFRSPLDISLQLAANFGELREDHFHMGIDARTMGREDVHVYAAADGYVSHIMIEQYGLGKALFITHPNGRTTVYGHLNKFTPALQTFTQEQQYAAERWEQELDIPAGRFPVSKGEFIAYSGNTGSSQAPHLHFEVRETKSGHNINPLLAGLSVPDEQAPLIKGLYWYDRRYSTYLARARKIAIIANNGHYQTASPLVRSNSPLISLGITTVDKSSNSPHLSGIFHAELSLDDSLIYTFDLSDLSDKDTRYINACIDYSKWKRSGIYVQHLSVLPGNHLSIFVPAGKVAVPTRKDGLIRLKDTAVHRLHIRVGDVYHNHSDLDVRVQLDEVGAGLSDNAVTGEYGGGRPSATGMSPDYGEDLNEVPGNSMRRGQDLSEAPGNSMRRGADLSESPRNPMRRPEEWLLQQYSTHRILLLSPGKENIVGDRAVRVRFSPNAFYDEVPLVLYEEAATGSNKASALVHLHDPSVPVHDRYSVQVRTRLKFGDPLRNRTVMQLVSGDSQSTVKGVWDGDWMEGSFNRLGTLQLLIDTIRPTVETSGWIDGETFAANVPALNLVCKDDLGLISRFRAELDGHWLLFEQKGSRYWYTFDGHCPAGRHQLSVVLADVAGNETKKIFSFIAH